MAVWRRIKWVGTNGVKLFLPKGPVTLYTDEYVPLRRPGAEITSFRDQAAIF